MFYSLKPNQVLYLTPEGNLLDDKGVRRIIQRRVSWYKLTVRPGKRWKGRITVSGRKRTPEDVMVDDTIFNNFCWNCANPKYDWNICHNVGWDNLEHVILHLALPMMELMRYRYPDEYELLMSRPYTGRRIMVMRRDDYDDDDRKVIALGNSRARAVDTLNLLDELMLSRDMSLRVYDEIMSYGDPKYYGTAMMAAKEVRTIAETLGKFSLVAKQLRGREEETYLPEPVKEMIQEVASLGGEKPNEREEFERAGKAEVRTIIVGEDEIRSDEGTGKA